MFGWGRTATEKKRDDYDKLHALLKDALEEHDKKISEASSYFSTYKSHVPNMSNSKIPSDIFEIKREELTEKLSRYFQEEKAERANLVQAKNKAYAKYLEYKAKAIKEEAAEKAKKEQERKEREERLKNG